jgi:glycosyltransferase involved in cell wall biosynthesis
MADDLNTAMETGPKVSVVMSVYDGLPYVSTAVESILEQTFEEFEFIIIDDGSTDGSTAVLRRYAAQDDRIRLIVQENRGLTPSLNRGLALAEAPLIARMDADDVCVPERFQKQVDFLEAHPEHVLVGSHVRFIDGAGDPISPDNPLYNKRNLGGMDLCFEHDAIEERLLAGGWAFIHPTVMMRQAAVEQIGGYNPKIVDAEDRDLFIRMAEVGRLANLPDVLLKYRVHGSQVSTTSAVQSYWSKRARRAGYLRRDLPLPDELQLLPMVRAAVGSKLRQTRVWPQVLKAYNYLVS